MAITYHSACVGGNFRELIRHEYYADDESRIMCEMWDHELGVLFVGEMIVGGAVSVRLFQRRDECVLGGIAHLGVEEFSAENADVLDVLWAIEKSQGAENPNGEIILRLVRQYGIELQALALGLAGARPGGRVRLMPTIWIGNPSFAGVFDTTAAIVPGANERWARLEEIPALIRSGYTVMLAEKGVL